MVKGKKASDMLASPAQVSQNLQSYNYRLLPPLPLPLPPPHPHPRPPGHLWWQLPRHWEHWFRELALGLCSTTLAFPILGSIVGYKLGYKLVIPAAVLGVVISCLSDIMPTYVFSSTRIQPAYYHRRKNKPNLRYVVMQGLDKGVTAKKKKKEIL